MKDLIEKARGVETWIGSQGVELAGSELQYKTAKEVRQSLEKLDSLNRLTTDTEAKIAAIVQSPPDRNITITRTHTITINDRSVERKTEIVIPDDSDRRFDIENH